MIKKIKILIVMLIIWGYPLGGMALDLDNLESVVSSQFCQGESCKIDCDSVLAQRIGQDLPTDADSCHSTEQYRLLAKGLYRTTQGEVKSLKNKFTSQASQIKINLPDIHAQKVSDKAIPYIIDLQTTIKVSVKPVNQPRTTKASNFINQPQSLPILDAPPKKEIVSFPRLGCQNYSTFGHRGGPQGPENSIPAVLSGLRDGHNGVEIDTQRLADGRWVVHHDPLIGRSSYGEDGFVNLLSSEQWKKVYLLNRNGEKTKIKAPFLSDLLEAFRQQAIKGQIINIEIKSVKNGQYSCEQLAELNQRVLSHLEPSQFLFSSTYIDALQCIRSVNHSVYLGLIVEPNEQSLQRVIDTQYGAEYRSVDKYIPLWLQTTLKNNYQGNREWLSHDNYVDLAAMIGPNFGLHIDYRDIDMIAGKVQSSGGRWMVYELNDDQGMLDVLKTRATRHQPIPPAVIIDSSRKEFCQIL